MFKYVAIDIETTGLDPEKHQILEFAAVLDDLTTPILRLPLFVKKIKWDDYVINDFCLELHRELLREIKEESKQSYVIDINSLGAEFDGWLIRHSIPGKYNVAGKNFAGFDGLFLKQVPGFPPWNYRVLDVGSMYLTEDMKQLPSLGSCDPHFVEGKAHRALADAYSVIRAVRGKLIHD